MSNQRLKGKVAIITGGSSGMGKDFALSFANQGAALMICGRSMDRLQPVVEEIRKTGGTAAAFECDVRNPDKVQEMVNTTVNTFGHLDILVNNAAGNFVCRAEDLSVNGWNAVVNIVLNGSWYCTQAVGKHMIQTGKGGCILNIVATYAWTGGPGVVHSAAAKAGVIAMTQTLAVEWGKYGIRVNCIAPGPIEGTGGAERLWPNESIKRHVLSKIPLGRLGTKEEITRLALFLVSDDASYITGDVVTADGGAWLNKGFLHDWEQAGQVEK
jgi:NAD(P)-dependent dehydrogenase (short-subunit alcohol dehydrogenase family)